MTSPSPKAMTAEERAIKILGIVRNPETINKNQIEMAAEQIKLAMEEEYKRGVDTATAIHEEQCTYAKGFSDGQVAMREMCAKEVEILGAPLRDQGHYLCMEIATHLRSLKPKAPMGEGTEREGK